VLALVSHELQSLPCFSKSPGGSGGAGGGDQGGFDGADGSGSGSPYNEIATELDDLLGGEIEEGVGESEGDEDVPYSVTEA
jgi:hypothetical protein